MRPVPPSPEYKVLLSIKQQVDSHLVPGIATVAYFFSDEIRGPMKGFLGFNPPRFGIPENITHKPGIPMEALVPEKADRIALWIVNQMRKDHPEWFRG